MSASLLRVGLAQVKASTDEPERNLETHVEMLRRAREQNVDLVVFPELSLSGYLVDDPGAWAERFADSFSEAVRAQLGRETAIVGTPRQAEPGGATNCALVVCASGVSGQQDKLYLPDY